MSATMRENVFANEQQRAEAGELVERLQASMSSSAAEVALPSKDFSRFLVDLLQRIAAGGTVTVQSMPEELTTSVAAEQLGISRQTLMKHIHAGRLQAHKVGTHTRVKTEDVHAFRRKRIAEQREALAELLELEDRHGLE